MKVRVSRQSDLINQLQYLLSKRLMEPYLDKGHHLYLDNFYNSVTLSKMLLKRKTHTTGILRSNRKGNPGGILKTKLERGKQVWARKGHIYISKWKDKRDVITTGHPVSIVIVQNRYEKEKKQPQYVHFCNTYISGVDRTDKLISYYSTPKKAIIWYKKVLFHLLDMAVSNSSYIFRNKHQSMRFLSYRGALIHAMIQIPVSRQLFANAHFLEYISKPNGWKRNAYILKCVVCKKENR